MGRQIIKLHDDNSGQDYYLEWSSIVDAPVSYGCNLDDFKRYYEKEHGRQGLLHLEESLPRIEKYGASMPGWTVDSVIERNHAGSNGKRIGKAEIIKLYCNNIFKEQK